MPQTLFDQQITNRLSGAPIRRILAPVWLGAEQPGVELGPAELSRGLAALDFTTRLLPPVEISDNAPADAENRLHRGDLSFLAEVIAANEAIATAVHASIAAGELAVVLGGDHSIAFGSLAGAANACGRLGVLWFDAHLDLNTPETSPSGHLHGMPLAAALGFGPPSLTGIGGTGAGAKLRPSDLAVLGIRDVDAGELRLVDHESIWTRTTAAWRAEGIVAALDLALTQLTSEDIDAVHVSFDLDVLDPGALPGTGTPVPGGLSIEEARLVFGRLRRWDGPIRSLDVVELNPALDPSGASARLAVSLLADLLV